MVEHALFHPVLQVVELGAGPVGVGLLGRELVLWRDPTGAVRVADARCPHRGASLALGKVVDGTLECGYHGWRFGADGRCIAIPALPAFTPPETHRACVHLAREAYGLIWVALDAAAAAADPHALPAFAAEDDPELRKINCGPYDVATSAPRVVENFLDMAHFGFVHDGLLGHRDDAATPSYRVEPTPTGFRTGGCRVWQPRSSVHATDGGFVEYGYEVAAPYTAVLTKVPEASAVPIDGYRESIALFVCPRTPETSRVWMRLAIVDADSPRPTLQAFQDTIFGQDRPILESQRPRCLPIGVDGPVIELHAASDRASVAYRRYLRERGVSFGVC